VITEGISNAGLQLVRRGEVSSRDSSRFDTSPRETVKIPEKLPLENPKDLDPAGSDPIGFSERKKQQIESRQEDDSKDKKLSDEAIQSMIQDMNTKYDRSGLQLRFGTDEESGLDYFQVFDQKKGEVVKQFPPENMLEMTAKLKDMTGILLNEKV